jgi:hypothetical protein
MIPLALKIGYTVFLALLAPVYWRQYGASNFLWFSDIALFGTCAALWLESALLTSMMALAALVPEIAWSVDFFARLATGSHPIGMTPYMFDAKIPAAVRALSLFHIPLPILLVWSVSRLGYDPRALPAQSALACFVLAATYLWTDPAANINWAFGPGKRPQSLVAPLAYLALVMAAFPLVVYLPTHLVLRKLFERP